MPANYIKTSSPPLSNTQPCLAPVSLVLQQVTNYIPASAAGLQAGPRNPEAQHGSGRTAIPGLLGEPHPSPHPQAELGARPLSWLQRGEGGAEVSALNFPSYTDCQRKDGSWELKSQHLEKARAGQAKIHLPAQPGALEPGNKDV